jgi:sugar/nucleoside kinase (ribokinase family)
MSEIWTMGEILVEIMRPKAEMQLYDVGEFLGPYPSGAPAIFIDTAARLGHSAAIIGGVGADDFGKCLLQRFKADGVDCSHIISVEGISTAVAFVTYFKDGSRKFIYHIGNTPAAMAKSPDISEIKNPKYFHIMGCSLMTNDNFYKEIVKTMEKFITKGAKVSFDPNIREELLRKRDINEIIEPVMRNCSVLLPGVDELLLLTREKTIGAAVDKVLNNGVTEIIALKQGKKGCTVYTKEGNFSLGVYTVVPVDPTGAGDSFDAAFLCGLLENKPLIECAKIATAAASLNTAAFGPMEGNISVTNVKSLMAGEDINV